MTSQLRNWVLGSAVALTSASTATACAFHGYTPNPTMVDLLLATEQAVIAAGLEPFNHGNYEPGRRFYFLDGDGVEYEVVSYTPAES